MKELQGKVRLKPGREKSVLRNHPWIFSGAVERIEGVKHNGEAAGVYDSAGRFLGVGSVSLQSQIRVRLWTRNEEDISVEFFTNRLKKSRARRMAMNIESMSDAWRWVHSEADEIPGLIADKYGNVIVLQLLSAGVEFYLDKIIEAFEKLAPSHSVVLRRDSSVRLKEGLALQPAETIRGDIPQPLLITEHGLKYVVNPSEGHKTGFYLDQRDNRLLIRPWCKNRRVLNCFSYTGGFGLNARAGGASEITEIELSEDAISQAIQNDTLNDCEGKINRIQGDVFELLRKFRDQGKSFDTIILDPPKFAESASQIEKAARGYKDINLLAMKLLSPEGVLITFSCSGHIGPELFTKIIRSAAMDAGRQVQVVRTLMQSPDHPVMLHLSESYYLKGLICRVL
ncbi:MAG: 23S rRNA (cytosine(1962)-C(5))-methyltransferase RlmI [Bacteroidales bacterium]